MKRNSGLPAIHAVARGLLVFVGLAMLFTNNLAQAETDTVDRIVWTKTPIRLNLVVGQEQRIDFPNAVKVGVPAGIQSLVRSQSVDGTIYLLAHIPFDTNRLMVRELASGRVYLLDVAAAPSGVAGPPLQVVVTDDERPGDVPPATGQQAGGQQPGYIELTRFAAQQLYAPLRLVEDRPGFVRVPVAREPVELLQGAAVDALPLVAWRAGSLYVTAVKLTNRTDQPQTLDPRALRGVWLAATFQHNRLLPKGDEADTTAVYLISARPFDVSR